MTSNVRIFLPAMVGYKPPRPGEVRWDCFALDYLPALIKLKPRLINYTLPGIQFDDPDDPWFVYRDYFITPVEPQYNIVIAPPTVFPTVHTPSMCNIAITGIEGMVRHEHHNDLFKGWEVIIPTEGVYKGHVVPPDKFEKWWFEFTMERS